MSKKRNKKGPKKAKRIIKSIPELKQEVLQILDFNLHKSFTVRNIAKAMGSNTAEAKRLIDKVLVELLNEGKIEKASRATYVSSREPEFIIGKVDHVNPRLAYIISEDRETDIIVKTDKLKGAFHKDTVKVVITKKNKDGREEGKVIEIVERAKTQFVGRIDKSVRYAFMIPDSRYIHTDFFINNDKLGGAQHQDKVIAEIKSWGDTDRKPEAKVIKVLGPAGENEAEIHSIMAEFELPMEFPEAVVRESEKISDQLPEKEISKRRDMRGTTTFTIDPEDAKDFDDAISFKKIDNGHYEIGIHIADVTYYVQPGTLLEEEAYFRATSVYLVDRTIPMLPERLSNGLCSLRPNEDKFTFSAVFELDDKGTIHNEWFGRTVTHSDRRFAYEEAQAVLEAGIGDHAEELTTLNAIAKNLKATRFKHGAIAFESVEVKFKLDENGKPLGVIPKVRKDAHKLVEEYMLLANRKVAEFIATKKKGDQKLTFVYRQHDYPDPEKLSTFSIFAKRFGHELEIEEKAVAKSLNSLMNEIQGKPEQNVLESLAIRSMAKAKYTTKSSFHFGLAFQYYTHFTSPIRRYPDVMVHRLLQHYLDQGKSVNAEEFESKCLHSSEMEKRASDAERASIKYKQVEFMASVEDKAFDGLVTGVTEWGIFVEIIETKCEGMVRLVDMTDDYYEFDEKNYRIIGQNNKRMITLGDPVTVRVKATDIDKRTIDLEFCEKEEVDG
ncbi:ribonuclease R [Marivirga harenae]|uniref:ribonuclease R n=1 Tax=Marivirga harenae TaxID=2010992 RepID=UPI0026DF536B|nr:ribonuclease R [Marivirga harenae]WKV10828.1 ribonuclease R [Marivirga harenae]